MVLRRSRIQIDRVHPARLYRKVGALMAQAVRHAVLGALDPVTGTSTVSVGVGVGLPPDATPASVTCSTAISFTIGPLQETHVTAAMTGKHAGRGRRRDPGRLRAYCLSARSPRGWVMSGRLR